MARANVPSTSRSKSVRFGGPAFSWERLQKWDQWPTDPPSHWPDPALEGLQYYYPDSKARNERRGESDRAALHTFTICRTHKYGTYIANLTRPPRIRDLQYIGTAEIVRAVDLSVPHSQQWCYRCHEAHDYH